MAHHESPTPKRKRGVLRRTLYLFAFLVVSIVVLAYLRYGGGKPYSYTPPPAVMVEQDMEEFFRYDEPIGNVAAVPIGDSTQARVFFTIHPESRPELLKLCEIVDENGKKKAIPYPNEQFQRELTTPLGVYCDKQNRLWVIDHGNHGMDGARLIAFDLATNTKVVDYIFPVDVAEKGSFLNDLSVTPDGKFVFIADVSFWRKQPSLIVFDVQNQRSRSVLDGHPSISSQNYVPITPSKTMRFFGGVADLMPGIDGIDIDPRGQYVYYAAMSHEGLYRVPVAVCTDFARQLSAIDSAVEFIARKPLSDGIRVDNAGNVLVTDIEHQGVALVDSNKHIKTLVRSPRIRWADGLAFGRDGYTYLADSDIPDQMLQSKAHIQAQRPYFIFRWKTILSSNLR